MKAGRLNVEKAPIFMPPRSLTFAVRLSLLSSRQRPRSLTVLTQGLADRRNGVASGNRAALSSFGRWEECLTLTVGIHLRNLSSGHQRFSRFFAGQYRCDISCCDKIGGTRPQC